MADLVPHPLVTRVGLDLAAKGSAELATPAQVLLRQLRVLSGQPVTFAMAVAAGDKDDECPKEKNDLAAELANLPAVPDLSLFAGFLGGPVKDKAKAEYRLLYLDSRLENWLLIPVKDIVVHERLEDDHAPSGMRDALWVRGAAMVVRGSGARSNEGRFLVGEFTRAADFAASATGGTFSAATGLLCEATTPGCCWGSRSR
jgi:hypothetical protein